MTANDYVLWFILTTLMTVLVIGLGVMEATGTHLREVLHRHHRGHR